MDQRKTFFRGEASRGYALLRIALGLNICLHGLVRWIAGLYVFADSLVGMFQKTLLPAWAVYSFGFALPVLETAIGGAVLLGFRTCSALTAGSVLMLVLTFGSTLRQDWQIAGIQLTYSLVYSLLLAFVRFDTFSLDQLSAQRPRMDQLS